MAKACYNRANDAHKKHESRDPTLCRGLGRQACLRDLLGHTSALVLDIVCNTGVPTERAHSASASISASGAGARSAGAGASARTSAGGADARSAGGRVSRCRTDWRSSEQVRIALQLVEVSSTRLADGTPCSSTWGRGGGEGEARRLSQGYVQ